MRSWEWMLVGWVGLGLLALLLVAVSVARDWLRSRRPEDGAPPPDRPDDE